MKNFAFIACPVTIEQLKGLWPVSRILPQFIFSSRLKSNLPIKISRIKKIQSIQGRRVQGHIFACPIFDSQARNLDAAAVQEKIIAAGRLAERLGADILGLDGCASLITEREYAIAQKTKIPLTNGSTLTAWSVFEAVYRIARTKKLDLRKSTLAIIDAVSPIGNLCSRKLSAYAAKIILNGKNQENLECLKQTILSLHNLEVNIALDIYSAIKNADIVINVNSALELILNRAEELKPEAIICCVSLAGSKIERPQLAHGITLIEAGLIKVPYSTNLGINLGLPPGIIYASLAEVALLALEEKSVSYSLGDNINPDKMEEIADIAVRHGFEVWVPEAPVL